MGIRSIRLVEVLEAAYQGLEGSRGAWLRGVLESVSAGLDQGMGVQGYAVDASLSGTFVTSDWQCVGIDDEVAARAAFGRWSDEVPTEFKRRVHSFAPFGVGSALPPEFSGSGRDRSNEAHGYPDILGVNALDAKMCGCAIAAASATRIPLPDARVARLWNRVAVHIATAARLQSRLALIEPAGAAEAVLDPGGRVVDASGPAESRDARQALRDGARAVDRARSGDRREDSDQTLELWQALVGGRWSLIDDFSADGRRYLLAIPNRPKLEPQGSLSEREREVLGALVLGHPTKVIAYELGLTVSTVGTHITRAAAKLGVRGRPALARLLATSPDVLTARAE